MGFVTCGTVGGGAVVLVVRGVVDAVGAFVVGAVEGGDATVVGVPPAEGGVVSHRRRPAVRLTTRTVAH